MLTYIFVYPSLQETITGQVTALRALDAHDHFLVKFHRPNAALIKLLEVFNLRVNDLGFTEYSVLVAEQEHHAWHLGDTTGTLRLSRI